MADVFLVWDGYGDERGVDTVHATRDGAENRALELVRHHEVMRERQRETCNPWLVSMYCGDPESHETTDGRWWRTRTWMVEIERHEVRP